MKNIVLTLTISIRPEPADNNRGTSTLKHALLAAAVGCALVSIQPKHAAAFALEFGVGGPVFGSIANFGNLGANTGLIPFSYVAPDATVTGQYGEYIVPGAGGTFAAELRVTDLTITNTGGIPINDNLYMVSDIFAPTPVAKPGFVGARGFYGSLVNPADIVSTQTAMGFLNVPINVFNNGFGTSVVTPQVTLAAPAPFFEVNSAVIGPGVQQLVATFNVNLPNVGDQVVLPGSVEVTDNYNTVELGGTQPELIPEPATVALLGAGLFGLVWDRRRRCVRYQLEGSGSAFFSDPRPPASGPLHAPTR